MPDNLVWFGASCVMYTEMRQNSLSDGTTTMQDEELGHSEHKHGHEQVGASGRRFNNALICSSMVNIPCMSNPSGSQSGQTVSLLLVSGRVLCDAPLFSSMQLCNALTRVPTFLNTQLQCPFF